VYYTCFRKALINMISKLIDDKYAMIHVLLPQLWWEYRIVLGDCLFVHLSFSLTSFTLKPHLSHSCKQRHRSHYRFFPGWEILVEGCLKCGVSQDKMLAQSPKCSPFPIAISSRDLGWWQPASTTLPTQLHWLHGVFTAMYNKTAISNTTLFLWISI
jgi:hypothetical protein